MISRQLEFTLDREKLTAVYAEVPLQVFEQLGLVLTPFALAHGLPIGLADVDNALRARVKVRIEAQVIAPPGMSGSV